MDIRGTLTADVLEEFKKQFYSEEKNILARNVCSRMDPLEASQSSDILVEVQPAFNYKVKEICLIHLHSSLSVLTTDAKFLWKKSRTS